MKRITALLLVFVMLFSICVGCKKDDDTKKSDNSVTSSDTTDTAGGDDAAEEENTDFIDSINQSNNPTTGEIVMKNENIVNTSSVISAVKQIGSKRITLIKPDKAVSYYEGLKQQLSDLGTVDEVDWYTTPGDIFSKDNTNLVVIPNASRIPNTAVEQLEEYVCAGGKLLTLGGPVFEDLLYSLDGTWYTYDEGIQVFAKNNKGMTVQIDPYEMDFGSAKVEKGNFGLSNSKKSVKAVLKNGQEMSSKISLKATDNAIGFWAKGVKENQSVGDDEIGTMDFCTPLYIKLKTESGSVWHSSVVTTIKWKYYMFTAEDFSIKNGSETTLELTEVTEISVGVSLSPYFESYPDIAYTLYIDKFHSFSAPYTLYPQNNLPDIYGLSPFYRSYEVSNAKTVTTYKNQVFVSDRKYNTGNGMFSTVAGTQGTGFKKNNTAGRFIPLLEVYNKKGLRSGYAAWMYVFSAVPSKAATRDTTTDNIENSVIASFGIDDGAFYNENGLRAIKETAAACLLGTYLVEGGTTEYTYITEDNLSMEVGITCVNENVQNVEAVYLVCSGKNVIARNLIAANGGEYVRQSKNGGKYYQLSDVYRIGSYQPDLALVQLKVNGVVVDQIYQTISFYTAKPESERHYVSKNGDMFTVDGKELKIFGVNYWPTNALQRSYIWDYEMHMVDQTYDRDVIYHDLLRIKEMGFNAVATSVFRATVSLNNNALDFIQMCDDLDLYVDLAIRDDAVLHLFDAEGLETLITKCHFAELDNIIAYDISWETVLGTYNERVKYDSAWRAWINYQYGGLQEAEKAWGVTAPTDNDGMVTGPSDEMLREGAGSKYTEFVAAYRRFIDDKVAEEYNYSVNHVKALDPYHLVSFRMNSIGSAKRDPGNATYDFMSLAGVMDIMEPEGYMFQRVNGNAKKDEGNLTSLYSNLATSTTAPMVWKEFGDEFAWLYIDRGLNGLKFNRLTELYEAQYYKKMYNMMLDTYTAGSYAWWYAGIARLDEHSEYGIINADGSDRACTKIIREYGPKLLAATKANYAKQETVKVTVDRDLFPNTIRGMFEEYNNEIQNILNSGKQPVLVTGGTGKTIAEVFDEPVGTKTLAGIYPRKYVNGAFKQVLFKQEDGSWKILKNGETIETAGKATFRITVMNSQLASWTKNSVKVVSTSMSSFKVNQNINSVMKHLDTTEFTITVEGTGTLELGFDYNGTLFGNRFSLLLR